MPVTIKDIAKQTDVSHSTVSRALHGSPLIAKNTAERIRQTALELGYFPSAAARSLNMGPRGLPLHKISVEQLATVIVQGSDQDPLLGSKWRPQMSGSIMLHQGTDGSGDHLTVMGLMLAVR